MLEIVGTSYPKHQFLWKLEVAAFQWMLFYDPFCDCSLNLRAVALWRALSLFPRSLCSVPGFPFCPLLGIKRITFLLFFLIPFTHLTSLNDKASTPSFDMAAEHLGQGGIWHQLGLFELVVPKLRSEGLQVGLGAHCKWPVDLVGSKCWHGWLLFANLQGKKAREQLV